ncbi:hypothetical protein AJ88_23485 [Mesorhizobium amorphae CCBAU 01583]|nr:hypothetical protein AJ88_23485 [Mesorhizobium amorphae CCBAU 01583]
MPTATLRSSMSTAQWEKMISVAPDECSQSAKKAVLTRHDIEPVGIGVQKRGVARAVGADLTNNAAFELGTLAPRCSRSIREHRAKKLRMWTMPPPACPRSRYGSGKRGRVDDRLAPHPGRLEEIVDTAGVVVGINYEAG